MYFQKDEVITPFNYKTILSWLVYTSAGAILYTHYYKISKVYWFLFFGLSSAIFLIFNADPGSRTLMYDYGEELKLSHLAISEKYILLAVFAITPFFFQAKFKLVFLMYFSVFSIALFVIGSRTMLYAYFLCCYSVYIFVCYKKHKYKKIALYTLAGVFFISLASVFSQEFIGYEGVGRMLAVFSNIEEDASVIGRIYQYNVGVSDILDNPFFGYYAGDIEHFGVFGNYIHGVLSYWRQFGFLPFVAIVILSISSLRLFVTSNNLDERTGFFIFLTSIFILTTFVSRTYAYPAIYLSIGAAIAESYRQYSSGETIKNKSPLFVFNRRDYTSFLK